MPRPRNEKACNTCRKRKLKSQHQLLPEPDNPRKAIQDHRIAQLFHCYTDEICLWYDLSDQARTFGTTVPRMALDEPLLFSAIITLAAMHKALTETKSFRKIATFYHVRCIRLLIQLKEDDELVTQGVALAATCLLRNYEIFTGDVGSNVHLRGAYAMASHHGAFLGGLRRGLLAAGFWNYLREEITFSLSEGYPLKIRLEHIHEISHHETDQDYLNSITLILGKLINMTFDGHITDSQWATALQMLTRWQYYKPQRLNPFCREQGGPYKSREFPAFWFLFPCHAAASQYFLLSFIILLVFAPWELFKEFLAQSSWATNKEDILMGLSLEICGMAFTTRRPQVLVNSFGPISYCAKFIWKPSAQEELKSQLIACKPTVGWPVQQLIKKLDTTWKFGADHIKTLRRNMQKEKADREKASAASPQEN
ncbi:hypothetical protein NM208_g14290 [Fusarium decemcellulare]|uniref:Uncharacterized protein n=1 Tax=Fusarium decemcellulare TaxID=57161 RepID=A0ACC1RIG1_9HYPO|nr:hypothetical protein NM208_g14290 [Fusarium decemcellulare]